MPRRHLLRRPIDRLRTHAQRIEDLRELRAQIVQLIGEVPDQAALPLLAAEFEIPRTQVLDGVAYAPVPLLGLHVPAEHQIDDHEPTDSGEYQDRPLAIGSGARNEQPQRARERQAVHHDRQHEPLRRR